MIISISIVRLRHLLVGAALLPALTGCMSFAGSPKAVLKPKAVVKLAESGEFSLAEAIRSATTETSRNAFVAIQMAAIDSRYHQFRRSLSAEAKGANFGLELGVLALTGTGAVVSTPLANILSAGGAGLTGTKAALNKEVYFERTLPALLASIDARRIELRAPILAGMRQPIDAYPVAQAIADLFAYQNSASLDGAIERITAAAAQDKAKVEQVYETVVPACSRPEPGVGDDWDRVEAALKGLDPAVDADRLTRIATAVGAPTIEGFADQRMQVVRTMQQTYCTRAAMSGLIDDLTGAGLGVTLP